VATRTAPIAYPIQLVASRWLLPFVSLAAFAVRLAVVFFLFRGIAGSDLHFQQLGGEEGNVARSLANGHGFSSPFSPWSGPTAVAPPLYTFLLAGVFRLFGIYSSTSAFAILSINSLLSALTCIPIYFGAKHSLGMRGARVAACVWAFYPLSIYFSAGHVGDYALTTLLFTTCFCIAQRIHNAPNPLAWMGWGLLYGLTALSNPAVLSVLPFLIAFALWRMHRYGSLWVLYGVLTLAAVAAVITPWTIRNYLAVGIVTPVQDDYWLGFYTGNSGDSSGPDPASKSPTSNAVEMRAFLQMGEPAYLAQKRAIAFEWVRRHPLSCAGVALRRTAYFWSGFWSFSRDYIQRGSVSFSGLIFVCSISLLMLRGIRRFLRMNPSAGLPYLVLVGIFPITFYLSHSIIGFRQPIEPAILVLAIAGLFPLRQVHSGYPTPRDHQWIGEERALEPESPMEGYMFVDTLRY
jgi:4-amino-4-deoxy-L-arabinose transferase-like glycosyltransferase